MSAVVIVYFKLDVVDQELVSVDMSKWAGIPGVPDELLKPGKVRACENRNGYLR